MADLNLEQILVRNFHELFRAGKDVLCLAQQFDNGSPFCGILNRLVKQSLPFHPDLQAGFP